MSGQTYDITFSVGLIEKVAGLRKPEPPRQQPSHSTLLPTKRLLSQDAERVLKGLQKENESIGRALRASKEVGGLLMKQEDEELQKINQKAKDLVKEYSVETKPVPCKAECEAVTQCFSGTKDVVQCAGKVDAYKACANKAFFNTAKG